MNMERFEKVSVITILAGAIFVAIAQIGLHRECNVRKMQRQIMYEAFLSGKSTGQYMAEKTGYHPTLRVTKAVSGQ